MNKKIINNDEIDLIVLFRILNFNKYLIIKISTSFILLGIIFLFVSTPLYKSTISMYPSSASEGLKLGGYENMANAIGLNLNNVESSYNIPDIIQSRSLKSQIIYNNWKSDLKPTPVNLINYWNITDDGLLSEEIALEELEDRISIEEHKTGLIEVDVLMEEPILSSQIANFIYDVVIKITKKNNLEFAKLNTSFIYERKMEIKSDLTKAENELRTFRSENRQISDSPQLQLELERLLREVEIQTQVYITLQQQYEIARIEEIKQMPSVAILDKAIPAADQSYPDIPLILVVSFILGLFSSFIYILLKR